MCIVLGVFVAERQVFELFLDFVESESVGKGGVDIHSLAGYLVLLAGQLAAEGTHVVETVADLDEYDSYVVAHGEEQLLEGFGLCRCLVAKDASADFGYAIDDACYLRAEDVFDVFDGVVCVFYDIVQQGRADTGAAQAYFSAGYLCDGKGVEYVWLA